MAKKKGRPQEGGGALHNNNKPRGKGRANRSPLSRAVVIEDAAACPLAGCGGRIRVTVKANRTVMVLCRKCGPDHGRGLLAAVAGVEDVRVSDLLDADWVLHRFGGRANRKAQSKPLPSHGTVCGWASRLWTEPEPLAWLTDVRGIAPSVLRSAGVGYNADEHRLTFPMYRNGDLTALKTREPRDGALMIAWAGQGRDWPLYPKVPRTRRVLLVAGELDALRGLSADLPAVSVPLGMGTWREGWTADLAGRHVYVCFDNNEQDTARNRVAQLRAAGIRAHRLSLRKLGHDDPKGDLTSFLDAGGTADEIREAMRLRRVRGRQRGRS